VTLVASVTERMDAYDIAGACAEVTSFIDALNNWYIRRSRDRFWAGTAAGGSDAVDAFDTLFTALDVLCRVAAPLLPMVVEEIYGGLHGGASVHLADWPAVEELPADPHLVRAMDRVRDVCSAASSVRKARGLRVRLPLTAMVVTADWAEELLAFADIICDEVNLKQPIGVTRDIGAHARYELKLVPAALGPRLGGDMQRVMGAFRKGDYTLEVGRSPVVGGIELVEGEYEMKLVPTDPTSSAVLPGGDGVITLDTVVTPELEAEGLARDVVRLVQQARRDSQLAITDRIELALGLPPRIEAAVRTHEAFIRADTLATSVAYATLGPAVGQVDGEPVHVTVTRAGG
jgi:isoleucyl-tRNA synthetase